MARGDYIYVNKKSNGNSSCYGGIRYRITNSLEDAIATNKDVIEMIMYVYRTSTGVIAHTGNYTSYYKYTIAGTTTTNNVTTTIDMSKATNTNTKYYLSSSLPLKRVSGAGPTITFEVPHNADGTAPSVSIQAYINFGTSSADYVNVTETLSLDTIPRGSILNPIEDFGLTDNFDISITKQVPSYTDNLVIKVENTTIKTYSNVTNGTNISFTTAEQNTIKGLMTSPQIELTFELSTFDGGTQIGETSTQTATVTTLDQPVLDSWVKGLDGYKYKVNGIVDETLDDGLQVDGELYKNGAKVVSMYVLYNSSSGTNGDVLLSDSVANYSFIDIQYRHNDNDDYVKSVRVYDADGKYTSLEYSLVANNSSTIYYNVRNIYISGTSIITQTTNRYSQATLKSSPTFSQSNNIYITKVVGYK